MAGTGVKTVTRPALRRGHQSAGLTLIASSASLFMVTSALASDFTVSSGTDTTARTVSNNDTGTVASGATLSTGSSTGITFNSGGTTPGVTINNSGSILATSGRTIDSTSTATSGNFTLNNNANAIISTTSDAVRMRYLTGTASGTVTINNSGTILSTTGGEQALDFGSTTSPNAIFNINNFSTGIIRSQSDDAVALGTGTIAITNSGLVESLGTGKRAINLNTTTLNDVKSFTLTNNADATIQSQGDAVRVTASGVTTTSATFNVYNYGTIKTTGTGTSNSGQAIDFTDIKTSSSINIYNYATGILQAADADAVRPGQNTTVYNYGQITSLNGTLTSSGNDGIDFQGNTGGTVYNYAGGTITGARHAITGDSPVTVTNYGTITGNSGSGINLDTLKTTTTAITNYGTIVGTSVTADGDGIDVDGLATINNYGTVKATGVHIAGDLQEAVTIGGGTINNYAGAVLYSFERAITVDDSGGGGGPGGANGSNGGNAWGPVSIYNEGTIQGDNGEAIKITSTFANTLTNKGVVMGSGNDTVNLYVGSSISGLLDGGAGTDALNLYGTGSQTLAGSGVTNFETLAVKSGGTWTLTGTHAYSGGATVESGGTLVASGIVNAAVLVNSGGTLQGTGTVGSFVNNGTVTPGASIGTMTVTGNATFNSGSVYQVKADASGQSDKISAGTATLNGGTVQVTASNGSYAANTNYTIVSTTGGRSGQFDSITSNLAFLTPSLSYGANDVTMTLTRNSTYLQQIAVGGNQSNVAAALDQAPTDSALYQAIVGLSASGAQQAFTALSGESGAAAINASTQSTGQVLAVMTDQFSGGGGTGGTTTATGYAAEQSPMAAYAAMVTKAKPAAADFSQRWTGWGSVYGGRSRIDGNSGAGTSASSVTTAGMATGFDLQLTPTTVAGFGIAAGRAWTSTNGLGSGQGDSVQALGRVGKRFGEYYVTGAASAAWTHLDSKRYVNFPGVASIYSANYNAFGLGGRLEAGRNVAVGAFEVTPFAALQAQLLYTPSYQEGTVSGASTFALNYAHQDTYRLRSELGLGVQHWLFSAGAPTRLYARAAWAHEYMRDPSAVVAFQTVPAVGFTVTAAGSGANAALLRAGADVMIRPNVAIGARIDSEISMSSTAYAGVGTVRVAW